MSKEEETPQFLIAVRGPTPEPAETAAGIELVPIGKRSESLASSRSKNSHANDARLKSSKAWLDLIRFRHSILPFMGPQMAATILWSTLVCTLFKVEGVDLLKPLPNSTTYTVVLGTSISLLLAFRTNTAYDRFWEGRRLFGALKFQMLNLARYIQVTIKTKTPEDAAAKQETLDLIFALAVAIKHLLRDEHEYPDLPQLISENKTLQKLPSKSHMPLHILTQIQAYIVNTKQLTNPICLTITGLSDSIAHLERIHSTPIPEAYACHMQQILLLYLAALPFQIVPSAGWMSIAITALAAYIMLGLRQIAQKIEDPFGHDAQDLPVDFYCDDVKDCIEHISKREASGLKLEWSNPIALDNRVEKKQKR